MKEDRFWKKVNKTDTCWNWIAAKAGAGYGVIRGFLVNESYAHRISWILKNGPIPTGLCVCHRCDNPACVNPEHLFTGTMQDNMNDKYLKNRQGNPDHSGTRNGRSKITPEIVRQIRNTKGLSQQTLAYKFNMSQAQISRIVRKEHWNKTT